MEAATVKGRYEGLVLRAGPRPLEQRARLRLVHQIGKGFFRQLRAGVATRDLRELRARRLPGDRLVLDVVVAVHGHLGARPVPRASPPVPRPTSGRRSSCAAASVPCSSDPLVYTAWLWVTCLCRAARTPLPRGAVTEFGPRGPPYTARGADWPALRCPHRRRRPSCRDDLAVVGLSTAGYCSAPAHR